MAKSRAKLEADWQTTNPPGLEDRPSIHEMIEETWVEAIANDKEPRLKDLFAKVADNWRRKGRVFGPGSLRRLISERLHEKPPAEETIRVSAYKQEGVLRDRGHNLSEAIAKTFALSNSKQVEQMFYRIAGSQSYEWEDLERSIDAILDDIRDEKKREDMFHKLHRATGMSTTLMADKLSVNVEAYKAWLWGKNACRDVKIAKTLLDLYLPNFLTYPKGKKKQIRNKALKAMTAKETSMRLNDVIEKAKNSDNPRLTLFNHCFTNKSVLGFSAEKAGGELGITENNFKKKCTVEKIPGETFARFFAKFVGANTNQTEEIITGIPSPTELIKEVYEKKRSFKSAACAMRDRKALKQSDLNGVSAGPTKKIEGGTQVSAKAAVAHANNFFPVMLRTSPEYYYHISHACGFDPKTQNEIISAINEPETNTRLALLQLIAFKGLTWTEFLRTTDIKSDPGTIMNRMKARTAEPDWIRKFEAALWLPAKSLNSLGKIKKRKNIPGGRGSKAPNHIPIEYGFAANPPSID